MKEVRYPALPTSGRTVVRITEEECKKLLEYSQSIPTGVVVGKWWKRNLNVYSRTKKKPLWRACCFVPDPQFPSGAFVLICYCPVRFVRAAT